MFAKLATLAVSLSFPALCLYCLSNHSKTIESAIKTTVQSSMLAIPATGVLVAADGRDITLTGEVATEELKIKAGAQALLLPGVRSVENRLQIPPPVAAIQTKLNELLLRKKIEFESAKDLILPSSTAVLREALEILAAAPDLKITVGGHTDGQGNAAANRVLSQRRAQAVVNWFSKSGIATSRMSAAGFGPDQPLASNATAAGRSENRRVEIVADRAVIVKERN